MHLENRLSQVLSRQPSRGKLLCARLLIDYTVCVSKQLRSRLYLFYIVA